MPTPGGAGTQDRQASSSALLLACALGLSQSSLKGCMYHALQLGVIGPRVFGRSFSQHTMILAHHGCKAAVIARACIKGPPWRPQSALRNHLRSRLTSHIVTASGERTNLLHVNATSLHVTSAAG